MVLLSHFSRVQCCSTPQTAAHQSPLSLGFSRQEHWSGLPFPSPMHKWKVKVKLLSRVRLFQTPWTAAYQAPPSMGFSRQEYWSGVPLPPLVLYGRPLLFSHSIYNGLNLQSQTPSPPLRQPSPLATTSLFSVPVSYSVLMLVTEFTFLWVSDLPVGTQHTVTCGLPWDVMVLAALLVEQRAQRSCPPADPRGSCLWAATVDHSLTLTDQLLSGDPTWPLDMECSSHGPWSCENPKVLDTEVILVLFFDWFWYGLKKNPLILTLIWNNLSQAKFTTCQLHRSWLILLLYLSC